MTAPSRLPGGAHPRHDAVERETLVVALHAAARRPLTVVRAPAGYGKTTLVAQWLQRARLPFAWLSLDEHDTDPRWLVTRLLAALDAALPERFGAAQRAQRNGADPLTRVIPLLADPLADLRGERFAIVLDDYHELVDDACHRLVLALLDACPPGVSVVVVTRREPPLRLARRRAAGTLAELGPEELRFGVAEAGRLLNETLRLRLEPVQVRQIHARLQGWAVGLALVGTALAGGERARVLDAVGRTDTPLDAYLVEEVLDAARPELRGFLCRTSILPRLSAPLCAALLEDPRAGELLAEVARDSLFVTPLADDPGWLRYHPVFAATLRRQLTLREPELVGQLHRRASAWFEQAAMPVPAIEHALAAGDGAHAAALLVETWPGLYAEGRLATLRTLVDRLRPTGGARLEAVDILCQVVEGVDQRITRSRAAALAARVGDDPLVLRALDDVLTSPFGGDVGAALRAGDAALERYADEPDMLTTTIPHYAVALWLAGDAQQVRELLEPRLSLPQPPTWSIWTVGVLALAVLDLGDAELAERHVREMWRQIEAIGAQDAFAVTGSRWTLGEILRARGKLDEARPHIDHAVRAEGERPGSVGHAIALTFDARLALAERDHRAARASAERARETIDRYADLGTLSDRLAEVEAALAAPDSRSSLLGSRPTPAEMRVLALLDGERSVAEIAAELYLSPHTVGNHIGRLYRRLGENTREGAVAAARERGLLPT